MNDWTPLREHLRAEAEAWIDDIIVHDLDAYARAFLAARRDQILERMVDAAELVTLRQIVAERTILRLAERVNGAATVQ